MAEEYRPGFWTWTGLSIVWASAAVLSFASLRDLAVSCKVARELAPLLPVTIDVGAAVSTRAWLSKRANPDAERFARRLTWSQLGLTVVLNAAHQGMAAYGATPPWWMAVVIGAIPAGTVGATVHLAVLLGRPHLQAPPSSSKSGSNPKTAVEPVRPPGAGSAAPKRSRKPKASSVDLEARALALLADKPNIGRRSLADSLGVSEHTARTLKEQLA